VDWKQFFKVFARSALFALVGFSLLFGLIGFLLLGDQEGFINGARIGFFLTLIGIPFLGGIILMKYWGDYAGRYGAEKLREQAEGKQNSH